MHLEIAVQDVPGAALAAAHGAARIELCCALPLGGLTPSQGLLRSVRAALPELPVHVLIRPRPGDYVYDEAAVALMVAEIVACREEGAAGIVIGALTPDGAVDVATVRTLLAAGQGLPVTFHRAIDHVADDAVASAVEVLASLGIRRILSSGGATAAAAGLPRLAAMQRAARGRVAIMAGGGVTTADIAAFHAIGLNDVHLSAKALAGSPTTPSPTAVAEADDGAYQVTDARLVAAAARAVALVS